MGNTIQYKLLFRNQSKDSKGAIYDLVRETKMYVFLRQENGFHTFRVHKNTLNVKGINNEKGYKFDVPRAISLEKV